MLIDILKKVVSGFSPEESVIDIVHQQNLSKLTSCIHLLKT